MEENDVFKEYYFKLENNKQLEEGTSAEGNELLELATCTEYWKKFEELSFNSTQLQEYFSLTDSELRSNYFKFGVACFFRFIQSNFTGPQLPEFFDKITKKNELKEIDFVKMLSMNNEDININTKHSELLVISKIVFEKCLVANLVNTLWNWRYIMIHQAILEELSPTLLSTADRLYKQIDTLHLQGYNKAKFNIEFAQLYLLFRYSGKAKEHITSACEILGVETNLIGKLGRRTKHQEEAIAQLALEVSLCRNIERPPVNDFDVPQNIKLKDDVRLDSIAFVEKEEEDVIQMTLVEQPLLPNTEQKLLLTRVQEILISRPQDDLQMEELQPFIELILSQKNTWCVRVVVLLLRSILEVRFRRTIERTMSQCEEIIASYNRPSPHVINRITDVFSTGLVPMWKVEAQFADVLLNLGLVKNSLEIYLKLKLWEEVILCYTLLKMKHLAAEIMKEQLTIKPTVKMWCLLGDATDDATCYEKAWELSKKRSHRAQRHWGLFLYSHKKYQECIPHLEKSLSINPLQANVWLRLGYAALQTENWQVAATAYRRYTTLEPDGFQAWNNLAQAYIKIGNKRSAHHSLLEALKYNFQNWKIWENLLIISCDISNFSDVIRAYHQMLDLKQKYLNIEILNVLVYNVCSGEVNDADGGSPERMLQKTRELLGRVTSIYPGEGYLWEMYATIAPDNLTKAQRFQRAYKAYTPPGWDRNPQTCVQVLYLCIKLSNAVLCEDVDATDTLLISVKLNLGAAVSAIRKHNWEDTRELVDQVEAHLQNLIEKLLTLNQQQQ